MVNSWDIDGKCSHRIFQGDHPSKFGSILGILMGIHKICGDIVDFKQHNIYISPIYSAMIVGDMMLGKSWMGRN